VVLAMAKSLHRELGDRRYSPPPLLRRLVFAGKLGKKTGCGIYRYDDGPVHENPELWPDGAGPTNRVGA
jgi:3-hydroxybutyryl-CoA dehydrogenase